MSAWLRIVVRQSIEHGLNSDYRVAVILSCLIIGIHVKQGNLPIVVKRLFKPFPVANRIKLVPAANTSVFVHFGEDRRRIYTISQFSVFVLVNLFQEVNPLCKLLIVFGVFIFTLTTVPVFTVLIAITRLNKNFGFSETCLDVTQF